MPGTRFIARAAFATTAALALTPVNAQDSGKLKVGLMLPATGTFAALGTAIENGFKLQVEEKGGKLTLVVTADDEADQARIARIFAPYTFPTRVDLTGAFA